jgi:hypothetical protein
MIAEEVPNMIDVAAFGGAVLAVDGARALPVVGNRVSLSAYVGVSPFGAMWRRAVPAAAAAAAMSAARHATAGHVADIPQLKHTSEIFASVNRGNT